jgi:hypothetical protein
VDKSESGGLTLIEKEKDTPLDQVKALTGVEFKVSPKLKDIQYA